MMTVRSKFDKRHELNLLLQPLHEKLSNSRQKQPTEVHLQKANNPLTKSTLIEGKMRLGRKLIHN